jgi:drug/metabolite transporter (DMT)-like permease
VFIGFAGVAIIAQAGGTGAQHVSLAGLAVGLLAALLIALATIQIRSLTRTESSIATVFYFALLGAPAAALFLPFFATDHDAQDWALLLGIGTLGTCAQFCATASLRFAPISTVMAMDYTAIIWTTLIAWIVWETLPGLALMLGAPLIVAAGLIITWRESLHKRPPPPSPAEFD